MKQSFNEDLKLLLQDLDPAEGQSDDTSTGTNEFEEVLQILIQDMKDSPDALHRQVAVQNYKIFCEAELTRGRVREIEYVDWMERLA